LKAHSASVSSVSLVIWSATSKDASGPKRSQRVTSCSAMSSIGSNIERTPKGLKAGIKMRCAFPQFGSWV
jgi:hypothetical protein